MSASRPFDPNTPALPGSGLFGLPHALDEAAVRVIPVPWEPTASHRRGTSGAPDRILLATHHVPLFDIDLGDAWQAGMAADFEGPELTRWNARACEAATPVLKAGGPDGNARLQERVAMVDALAERVNGHVRNRTAEAFDGEQIPAVLGGDHSVAFGAIQEAVVRHPDLGILQIDAHADLRVAYQGFTWSHASTMENVLSWTGLQGPLVQVGLRDLVPAEWERIQEDPRIQAHPWREMAWALGCGASWEAVARPIVEALPEHVWISLDIDGLDPSLCPNTGRPVPGGLSWDQLVHLLRLLRESGRSVIGFDLVEVGDEEWDGLVGARVLYHLAATAILTSRERSTSP